MKIHKNDKHSCYNNYVKNVKVRRDKTHYDALYRILLSIIEEFKKRCVLISGTFSFL